ETLAILAFSKLATFGTAVVTGHGLRLLRSKPIMELRSALRLTPRADFVPAVASNYRRGLKFKSGRRPRLDLDQHFPGTSQEHYPLCYGAAKKSLLSFSGGDNGRSYTLCNRCSSCW